MSVTLQHSDPAVALSAAHALVDGLQALDLTSLGDEALLEVWRDLERLRRRLPAVEHGLVVETEARGLPETLQVRGVTQLLRGLLRLDPREAAGRVKAAHALGVRRSIAGEPLPAPLPALAAAQASGAVSERQVRVVAETMDKLPDKVRDEHGEAIESDLVGYAEHFDPIPLARLAERLRSCYDPDGTLDDVDQRERHRGVSVQQRADGSAKVSGELTAECTELLLTHFDAFARPTPAVEGVKDPRSAEQRRHDALLEALKLNLRAQVLPTVAGVTATIVMTMTADEFESRRGLARTGHGALIPVEEAMRITAGEYRLMNVVIDKTKGITAYSSAQRLFTEQQRLAQQAVDGGCTFPNCPMPAAWCEIDHATDYAAGGPTRSDNAVIACRHDNNHRKKQGWRSTRINGRAAWIPPRWIDPRQEPRFNDLHRTGPP